MVKTRTITPLPEGQCVIPAKRIARVPGSAVSQKRCFLAVESFLSSRQTPAQGRGDTLVLEVGL